MAVFAGRWEPGLNMIDRRFCAVVVGLVTGNARGAGQFVVIVHMAQRAGSRGMETGQRPPRTRVVEFAVRPQHGVMAVFAGGRETQTYMVHRSFSGIIGRLVAGYASRIR